MKKISISLLLVCCIICTILPAIADDGYMPYSGVGLRFVATVTISNGRATASGGLASLSSGKIQITIYLQEKKGSTWRTIASEIGDTSAQVSASATKNCTYRAMVKWKEYDSSNTLIDSGTYYGSEQTY